LKTLDHPEEVTLIGLEEGVICCLTSEIVVIYHFLGVVIVVPLILIGYFL
jgi:hypothetical protein